MVFTQNIDLNNIANNQEVMKICIEHPECVDCQLKDNDIRLGAVLVRCETGRAKQK